MWNFILIPLLFLNLYCVFTYHNIWVIWNVLAVAGLRDHVGEALD